MIEEEMEVSTSMPLENIITPHRANTSPMEKMFKEEDESAMDEQTASADKMIEVEDETKAHGQTFPVDKMSKKKMEVSTPMQLENIKTPQSANTSPETQIYSEETADVHATSTAASLTSDSVCKSEESNNNGDSEDSDRYFQKHTVSAWKLIDSSSSSSSSSLSSSSPSRPMSGDDDGFSQPAPIKTRDEVLLEELPVVEEVCLSLPEDAELHPIGTVSSIIQQLVIIQSLKDTPALTDDSILFRSDRLALAKVFEVFGPVSCPLYILRFSSADQISNKGLTEGLTVYYAPPLIISAFFFLLLSPLFLSPPDNPDHITQNILQQQDDSRVCPPRHARLPFRHQNLRKKHFPFRQTHTPPNPMYLHPPCPYPPPPPHPFPPPNFPLYSPPLPPPSFFNPPFSYPIWPPNSVPFSDLHPPPPPPP
uniref:H/ACA ribonucleoprotein complex non-core subunit NAF1 n=1 Tax=Mola mola TaxID=94237 RepID=A0A3Q3XGN2_MOLML